MPPSKSKRPVVTARQAAKAATKSVARSHVEQSEARRREAKDSSDDDDSDFEQEEDDDDSDTDKSIEGDEEEHGAESTDEEKTDDEKKTDDEEEDSAEEDDDLEDVPAKTIMIAVLNELRASRKFQAEMAESLKKTVPSNAATAGHPGNAARKAKRDSNKEGKSHKGVLPLDGSTRIFGSWRKLVLVALYPYLFKGIGARWVTMPFSIACPLAMAACGFDSNDSHQRARFEFCFKSELSRVGSKIKQMMGEFFFDQLLVLFQLPPIKDAASPCPPHLAAHKAAFENLRSPPPGFDGEDTQNKYAAQWMTSLDATNQLMVFETAECRKLFEVDFFARCVAKGLLPLSARKWNLASLAWFLVYTHARLFIVRRADGSETYGKLRDDNVLNEIERVCEWLMDPIACPTTWPVLLKIRSENTNYGVSAIPVVA